MDYQELSWTTRAGVIIDYQGKELSWSTMAGFIMDFQARV